MWKKSTQPPPPKEDEEERASGGIAMATKKCVEEKKNVPIWDDAVPILGNPAKEPILPKAKKTLAIEPA